MKSEIWKTQIHGGECPPLQPYIHEFFSESLFTDLTETMEEMRPFKRTFSGTTDGEIAQLIRKWSRRVGRDRRQQRLRRCLRRRGGSSARTRPSSFVAGALELLDEAMPGESRAASQEWAGFRLPRMRREVGDCRLPLKPHVMKQSAQMLGETPRRYCENTHRLGVSEEWQDFGLFHLFTCGYAGILIVSFGIFFWTNVTKSLYKAYEQRKPC